MGEVSPADAQHLTVALRGPGNVPAMQAAVNRLPVIRHAASASETLKMGGKLAETIDTTAEKMLVYQRSIGGWPKAVKEKKVDYKAPLSAALKAATLADGNRKDATIDNNATTREIEYLAKAYKATGNAAYRQSAEKGIRYLLKMQHKNGGFPQFYPDSSGYRAQITYNDNAMVRVLTLLKAVAEGKADYAALDQSLAPAARQAVERGVSCILKTQYVQRGKLTAWCAQHDRRTLLPVKARAFELASLSGMESVGIVQFLMSLDNPSPEVRKSIEAAVAWLQQVKMDGFVMKEIVDASQPSGRDRVIVPEAGGVVWARFYDLETNQPIYVGRDGQKHSKLSEIENERRAGYVYASNWPQKLLTKDYPKWQQKWEKKAESKI
ncbi:pectate lyase [Hymenobacter sp. BT635]|uniref:Pectate lyase n=1 Tax=Hymenobacter nitidus TaxID=2880929 RepID=A0ABS8AGK0_9BACT|nr:pectate lyase [Hymenobacter nitidus]MCB2379558.1 pectate lyase [Hymenobacter nitidus]